MNNICPIYFPFFVLLFQILYDKIVYNNETNSIQQYTTKNKNELHTNTLIIYYQNNNNKKIKMI
jgi:hypothetical protein